MRRTTFREFAAEQDADWVGKGHKLRHFFPHRLFALPKCGPDGYRIAQAMWGLRDLGAHCQLLMYCDPAIVEQFPSTLFFDDELIWHQQHFGQLGQVATASVVIDSGVMFTCAHHSDLVQRIGRFRRHKTRIEKLLNGWPWMVLNGLLAFARERGIGIVRVPGSRLAMRHTDKARTVQPYLFERVYDRTAAEFPGAVAHGDWWEIDVAQAAAGVIMPSSRSQPLAEERVVCVFHDLERGLGHQTADLELAHRADATAAKALATMLAVEAEAGLKVTYNVVGQIIHEVRDEIESAGHALAFHSFDHGDGSQLRRCRKLDYRLKGYRPPCSVITAEISDDRLALHNFEWLASSTRSLGTETPVMRNRLVRLPVTFDDFPLYTGAMKYEDWEQMVLCHVASNAYTAIGLHDCYAHMWLSHYAPLLERLSAAARPRTFDEVSAEVVMGAAV